MTPPTEWGGEGGFTTTVENQMLGLGLTGCSGWFCSDSGPDCDS